MTSRVTPNYGLLRLSKCDTRATDAEIEVGVTPRYDYTPVRARIRAGSEETGKILNTSESEIERGQRGGQQHDHSEEHLYRSSMGAWVAQLRQHRVNKIGACSTDLKKRARRTGNQMVQLVQLYEDTMMKQSIQQPQQQQQQQTYLFRSKYGPLTLAGPLALASQGQWLSRQNTKTARLRLRGSCLMRE